MDEYLRLLRKALRGETRRDERTGAGTVGVFQEQGRFDLAAGFPIVTTKPTYWNGVLREALWFLSGSTNIRPLLENKVRIWSSDCLRHNLATVIDSGVMTQDEIDRAKEAVWKWEDYGPARNLQKRFERAILDDEDFAARAGELGPVYGAQWRGTNGAIASDQIAELEDALHAGGASRRMLVDAWNSAQRQDMALPPCHLLWQAHVGPESNALTLGWYQRSCDTVLGVPFNIASYALIANLLAHTHGFELGELVGTFADLHVYLPHKEAAEEQLGREPQPLPSLEITAKHDSITDYTADEIKLVGYNPLGKLSHGTPMFGGFF